MFNLFRLTEKRLIIRKKTQLKSLFEVLRFPKGTGNAYVYFYTFIFTHNLIVLSLYRIFVFFRTSFYCFYSYNKLILSCKFS